MSLAAAVGLPAAHAQTQDTSGNSMLNGTFAFRHVAVQNVDANFDPSEVTATYGTIAFDGQGGYQLTGTSVDNTVLNGSPQPLHVSGTYAIGSNGAGYVANPLYPTDPFGDIYGAFAQGVFTGSTTEAGDENGLLNDIFIAIPLGAAPTNANFTSAYQAGLLDFEDGGSGATKNALFNLAPDGKGGLGTITVNGQASNLLASSVTQTITGATYTFSGGSASLTVPLPAAVTASRALFTGSKTMYLSANGNFILGWTSAGYDIFFGVSALTGSATNSTSMGLYFNAALEDVQGLNGVDSYYGSINNSGDSAGDGIVHERLSLPFEYAFDYGTDDQITLNPDGTTPVDLNSYEYALGAGGMAYVGIGTNNGVTADYALVVGLHAPAFSGPGVYLNPVGVFNAASLAPITMSLAPGELILLTGSGLANTSVSTPGGVAFPGSLGGVTVTIDGTPCALYFVGATEIAATVPYDLAFNQTGLANIQVNNNGAMSNVVQMYFSDSAPGAFAAGEDGIGLAAATHAATGALVTTTNPAQGGETIALYLTGLGTVTPSIQDGAVGPSSPLSNADLFNAGNLTVLFNDYVSNPPSTENLATVAFAGLTPTLAGLYQVNVRVPTTGLGPGDNVYVEFVTDMADVNQIQIPYGSSGPTRRARPSRPLATAAHLASRRSAAQSNIKPAVRPGRSRP